MKIGDKSLDKKGQVSFFIILGILIVVAIILIFIFQNDLGVSFRSAVNPTEFIESCTKDKIRGMTEEIISNGGVYYKLEMDSGFYDLNSSKVALLCDTNISRKTCLTQHPLILDEAEYTITSEMVSVINSCFDSLQDKYPQVEFSDGEQVFEIEIIKDQVLVNLKHPLSVRHEDSSNYYSDFSYSFSSEMYDFLKLASLITNYESSCVCNSYSGQGSIIYMSTNGTTNPFLSGKSSCDVDLIQMNKKYPDYFFSRETLDSGVKIYTINSISSSQEFSFAVRNCIQLCDGPNNICYHHYHVGDVIHYSATLSECHNQIHHYHDETWEYVIDS